MYITTQADQQIESTVHCINVWKSFLSLHGCWNSAAEYSWKTNLEFCMFLV